MSKKMTPAAALIAALMQDDLLSEDVDALKNLLLHAWEPIDYDYVRLTPSEKQLISEESFKRLSDWAKGE
jgi:hypothetical protein